MLLVIGERALGQLTRINARRNIIHAKRTWRFYFDRSLNLKGWRTHLVSLHLFLHDLAVLVRELEGLVIEDAALFFENARNKIWCDVGRRVCCLRPNSSLVARHIWTQMVFKVANS